VTNKCKEREKETVKQGYLAVTKCKQQDLEFGGKNSIVSNY